MDDRASTFLKCQIDTQEDLSSDDKKIVKQLVEEIRK